MQPIITIWTISVDNHPGTIPVEFGQITISDSREIWSLNFFPYNFMYNYDPRGGVNFDFTPWPTYATNRNGLNNLCRGQPSEHSSEDWSKSNELFQRRRCFSKKVDGPQTTHDDGRRTKAGHKSSTRAYYTFLYCWRNISSWF